MRPAIWVIIQPAAPAIVVPLLSLTTAVTAGLLLYGADKGLGPLAGWLAGSNEDTIHSIKEIHEFFANFTSRWSPDI